MDKIILILKRVGLLYIISSALSLSINFKDWNGLSIWVFIIILSFTINDMFLFKLKYFNRTKNVGTRPIIQHRPKPMIRRKSTPSETSKISDTKKIESTSIGFNEVDQLSAFLSLNFMILKEEEKLDFLGIFLQLQHNNTCFEKFYEVFPDFTYNADTNRAQFINILNNPCPLDDILAEDEEIIFRQEQKLIKFLKSIKSPSEIFRFYSVFYCVKGNKDGQEKFLRLSYDSREAEKKSPHYSNLIHLTEIQMLIHNKNYVKVGKLLKDCNETFLKDNSFGEESRLLKLRFAELM